MWPIAICTKGWKRNLGVSSAIVVERPVGKIKERMNVLRGLQQDPFDVYEWLDSLHLYCG